MKILIPLDVPDDCDFISMTVQASSPEMIKAMEYDYETSEIGEFARSWRIFEAEVIKRGLL